MAKRKRKREREKDEDKKILQMTHDFKQVCAIGASGGFDQYAFNIDFYNRVIKDPKTGETLYLVPVEITLSPIALKELSTWLDRHIKAYEKEVGQIEQVDSEKLEKYRKMSKKKIKKQ